MMTTSPVGQKYDLVAEINMIPLIDVSLVILIIFMVLTPVLVRSQLEVKLPTAQAASVSRSDDRVVIVQVDHAGSITVAGAPVSRDGVEAALQNALQGQTDRPVIVEADKGVPFEYVVDVMDAAKKVGVATLAVAALKE